MEIKKPCYVVDIKEPYYIGDVQLDDNKLIDIFFNKKADQLKFEVCRFHFGTKIDGITIDGIVNGVYMLSQGKADYWLTLKDNNPNKLRILKICDGDYEFHDLAVDQKKLGKHGKECLTYFTNFLHKFNLFDAITNEVKEDNETSFIRYPVVATENGEAKMVESEDNKE